MLRILFTAQDLARIRLRPHPDPLWEITNAFQMLRHRHGERVFGLWRHTTKARLSPTSRLLLPLLPPVGYSPDFLTPDLGDDGADIDTAVETVLRTPRARLRGDLARLAGEQPSLDWATELPDKPHALSRLEGALHAFHAEALSPVWPQMRAYVEADRSLRLRTLLERGHEGLLARLSPRIRWRPPVLELDYPAQRTLRLEGRGLALQPSFFCWRTPVMVFDSDLPPVLVYPVHHRGDWYSGPPARDRSHRRSPRSPLAALVGDTRAALMDHTQVATTTGELARRLGMSTAAVSQHTAILRGAGLLITVRQGSHAFHTLTPHGRDLLHASAPRPADR